LCKSIIDVGNKTKILSMFVWRLLHNRLPTKYDLIYKKNTNYIIPFKCERIYLESNI